MGKNSEYEIAIKVAGEIEKSFGNTMGLTRKELYNLSRQAVSTNSTFRSEFSAAFDVASQGFERVGNIAKEALELTAKVSAAGLTVASAIGAAAVKDGASYEAQMSTVRSITMASGKDMQLLEEKAKEMGATTAFSASEAGQAMEYMAMAGWKTQEMTEGIGGIMNLAAASGEDLASVSDIVTDALTAFGLTAEDSGHFADVLAAASSNANTNVSMMGETFKYVAPVAGAMGYSVEDSALAIGLMANSGIKASQAGTALRSMLSRLAKPTDEVQKTMDSLGVSLTNSDGSMKSLNEVMTSLRGSFAGMSEAEQTQAAATLAGQEAMSGLLAIVNASDADVSKLADSINNCSGAAEKMADIRLDNLSGDFTQLKSATEGLNIDIFEDMNPALRSGTQLLTGYINEAKDYLGTTGVLSTFFDDVNEKIPTFAREIKEAAADIKEFAQPLISTGEWLVGHPDVIKSSFVGIGTTLVSFKIASKIKDITTEVKALNLAMKANPWSLAISAIGIGIGVFAGIRTEIRETQEQLKDANLAEHFGDISLSLEELDEIATAMTTTDSLEKLGQAMTEFDKAEQMKQGIDDIVEEINKTEWKVGIGLELTDEEKSAYQDNIVSFIQQSQDLLTQDQYAATVNMELFTNDDAMGQQIRNETAAFYEKNRATLAEMGTNLQNTVNEAFEDGFLDIDEVKEIQELQEQISEMERILNEAKEKASYEVLEADFGATGLTAESFQNLQTNMQEKTGENLQQWKQAYEEELATIETLNSLGAYDPETYEQAKRQARSNLRDNELQASREALEYSLDVITNQYADEMEQVVPTLHSETANAIKEVTDAINSGEGENINWENIIGIMDDIQLDPDTMMAIQDLYKSMEPSAETVREIRDECIAAGQDIPEWVNEALYTADTLGVISGSVDSMWQLIADTVANDPAAEQALTGFNTYGGNIPQELADGMKSHFDACELALQDLCSSIRQSAQALFGVGIDIDVPVRTNYLTDPGVVATAETKTKISQADTGWVTHAQNNSGKSSSKKSGKSLASGKGNKDGGIFDTPHVAWFAEDGPEAAIPLDGSENAKSLWAEAGDILGMSDGGESRASRVLHDMEQNNIGNEGQQSIQISYNPSFHFDGGNVSKEEVKEASRMSFEEFKTYMNQYMHENKRISFS